MNKLYYIVCEEKDKTLFEGRFQGRTRGAALKFLKESIKRPSLNGTVFTITEIPVNVIREIVEAVMKGKPVLQAEPKEAPTPAPANGKSESRSQGEKGRQTAKPKGAKDKQSKRKGRSA